MANPRFQAKNAVEPAGFRLRFMPFVTVLNSLFAGGDDALGMNCLKFSETQESHGYSSLAYRELLVAVLNLAHCVLGTHISGTIMAEGAEGSSITLPPSYIAAIRDKTVWD